LKESPSPVSADAGTGAEIEADADVRNALDLAKQAVISGDQMGCIRALQGAPKTGMVVRMLWYCYYNGGNIAQACAIGREYERHLNSHQKQAVLARCR